MKEMLALLLAVLAAPAPAQADPAEPEPVGTDQPAGSAEPPAMTHDRAADRYWDAGAMARAETTMMDAHSAPIFASVRADIAERQFRKGADGWHWDGTAWLGDVDRFVIRTEGEATSGKGIDHAEIRALYSKALDPWWNLAFGIRQDIRPRPARTWATIGVEGHAPYLVHVDAAALLSDNGQLTARLEAAHDARLTQRLILQPRVQLNLSAQDMPRERIGSGLSDAELGLRLRYELRREFAPYIGVSWSWSVGRTADYARADGEDTRERAVVAGIRFWF